MHWLVKLCGWWLGRGSLLLRHFLHAIGAARPRDHLAVGNDRLALLKRDATPHPIHFVADPIRNVSTQGRLQNDDAGVVVIESRIMRPDHRIMIRRPLQFADVSHTAGYHRIGIDRTVLIS